MTAKIQLESKISALGEVGNRLDDLLDASKLEQAQYEGARQALLEAGKKVEDHLAVYVKKDVEEGRLTIDEHVLVSKYMRHCLGILENLGKGAEIHALQSQGKIMAFTNAVQQAKHLFDVNQGRYSALQQIEQQGEKTRPEVVGEKKGHPGNPLADRREFPETTSKGTGKKVRRKG